ncbi:MAG: tRNA (adenosine(37)-N6)-threonylcarbamoyltransferase complex ATPase subunit type 1 TsaE, partial [Pseudomonadota bacterium]
MVRVFVSSVQETHEFAAKLVQSSRHGGIVSLTGDLGAGKTEFVRGCLRFMGETGPVRSPTYTLVENYKPPGFLVAHLDLYRLSPEDDMSDLGFRELNSTAWCFVEWPDRLNFDVNFDLGITLTVARDGRWIE